MTKFRTLTAIGILHCGLLPGCTAPVGSSMKVPADAQNTCATHCHDIGMQLSAVAIMADNVGCVCRLKDESSQVGQAESVTGGMATIMLQQEANRQQQQQQQQQQQASY